MGIWTQILTYLLLKFRADFGSQWNRGYYGKQNYGGYGYGASQSQDSMYAAGAAYGASPNSYGNHQQPVS
ncbi:Polyadenylate-binding protein RBP47 [Capsicum chinense]|nr:Polyadenylate-binding protein RBP47 [Capsicum chinense]